MTLIKCNYLSSTNLFFCYFHSYYYNFKISGKKLHFFTLFSMTSHCFSLFLVDSESMLALLPFKATTITPRHLNDKTSIFTWLVGTWFANFAFAHHISNSWCATKNPVPDSTYHMADLNSRVWPRSLRMSRPCMTATPWRRVNWKMCDENSTLLASTPFVHNSMWHDHILVPFVTFWQF